MQKKSYSASRILQLQKIGFQLEASKQRKQNENRKKLNEIKHEQKKSLSRKRLLTHLEPKLNIGNFLQPTKIISVTANKWVVYDFFSLQYIRGYRAHHRVEMGVFSKLLVFCTINTLIKKHKLDPTKFQTIVTSNVLKMFPQQKTLQKDDIISLQHLLSMMIVEDSQIYEVVLSANVGAYLERKHHNQFYSVYDLQDKPLKEHLKYFYQLVNSYCKLIQLENVKYIESDPLLRKDHNFCSASDIAKLSIECLNVPLFVDILKLPQQKVQIKYVDDKGHMNSRQITIKNKSIQQKYIPYLNVCRNWQQKQFLSSHCAVQYEDQRATLKPILIVLLGSYSPKDRQKDIQQTVEWYFKYHKQSSKQKQSQQSTKIALKTQPVQKPDNILDKKIQEKLSLLKNLKYDFGLSDPSNVTSNKNNQKRIRQLIKIKTEQSQ